MTEQGVPPQVGDVYQQMTAMMTSHWVSQAVRAVADLSLADHLAAARLTAAEVAEREGSAPTTTFRLMRACVAIGLLTADANGRFGSTPLLQTLRKDTPGSLRELALAMTQPSQWLPLNEFVTSVRTGQSQVSAALGMDFFDYLEQHPSQAREFSAGVGSTTAFGRPTPPRRSTPRASSSRSTSAGQPVRYCNSCRKPTRNCAGSSSTGPTSSMTRWPKSRGRASPNAPRSLAATSSSRCRPPTSTS